MSNTANSDGATEQSWPHGPSRFERRFGNNLTRITVAVIAIPLILGLIYLGGWWFAGLVMVISLGAQLEFYWMLEKKGWKPKKWIGVSVGLIYMLLLALLIEKGISQRNDVSILLLCIGVLLLLLTIVTALSALGLEKEDALESFLSTLGGFFYIPFQLGTLLGLYLLFDRTPVLAVLAPGTIDVIDSDSLHSFYFLLILLSGIWICDSGAYFGGRAFGRRKLFERVSPKKTWEGAIIGALASIIGVALLMNWAIPYLAWYDGVVIGAIAGVLGQIGDLIESHFKRACGVKDSSHIIPGHGGILDRFDSLLLVAPAVFIYIVLRAMLA